MFSIDISKKIIEEPDKIYDIVDDDLKIIIADQFIDVKFFCRLLADNGDFRINGRNNITLCYNCLKQKLTRLSFRGRNLGSRRRPPFEA